MTLQCFAFAQRSLDSASSVLELASHRPNCSLKSQPPISIVSRLIRPRQTSYIARICIAIERAHEFSICNGCSHDIILYKM